MKRLVILLVSVLLFASCGSEGEAYPCAISIECSTVLEHMDQLRSEKVAMIPEDGVLLKRTETVFYEGESVFDVLQRCCREQKLHMESEWTPIYQSAYIEGIGNLYEFDCGAGSGWTYCVNGQFPNVGASGYELQPGDEIEWHYTCELGADVGAE